MYTSQSRSSGDDIRSFRAFFAVTMLIAAAVVFFGLQVMMVGPLKSQLSSIQARLDDSEKDMRKLVAERNQLWKTNDLLSSLQDQAKQVDSIHATLASMQTLREHVQKESLQTQNAIASFNSISALHKQLAAQGSQTKIASSQLDSLLALRQTVTESGDKTDAALAAIDDLADITDAAIAGSTQIAEAEESITKLSELKYRMLGESDGLAAAEQGLERIVSLHKKLSTDNIASAEENANRLLVINDSLAAANTEAAGVNLDGLINLESKLAAKGAEVAQSIQSLEILDDFRVEMDSHIRSIEGIRRTMVEIAMLESSVGRAARVLQPLVELSNLRRLGEREVREAARVILDQRTTRLSQNTSIAKRTPGTKLNATASSDNLVPIPPEANKVSAE